MTVAIIDYGSGNLLSAVKAFERAARGAENIVVTADADVAASADRIVLPGVGAFADCKAGLDAVPGMVEALTTSVIVNGRPFLGICVGMQLMASIGFEHGVSEGFGWIPGKVVVLAPRGHQSPAGIGFRTPHMGWNQLEFCGPPHPVFAGLASGCHTYFVHSYQLVCDELTDVVATTVYGETVTAIVGRDNIIGTQFHPEKSQKTGLLVIENFLRWTP